MLLVLVLLFVSIQFYRPRVNDQLAIVAPAGLPDSVREILQRACYDCHSDSTRLSWFDKVAPAYWLVGLHVTAGKAVLNFSSWDSISPAERKGILFESLNQMEYKAMPLSDYLLLHGGATPTAMDIATLRNYLSSFDSVPVVAPHYAGSVATLPNPAHVIEPEWTGFEFLPDYRSWAPISASERFDNGSLRLILANDIARAAILNGQTNPWPDGAAFAKIAWKQTSDSAGEIRPGDFIQVELMLRDSKKYAATYNWGWGRWRGPDLTPYGKNAQFVGECMRCHLPMKSSDFVFTIPVKTALDGRGVSTIVDRQKRTISIVYGKDSGLAQATWPERDDPHWYGARIPAAVAPTVEPLPGRAGP